MSIQSSFFLDGNRLVINSKLCEIYFFKNNHLISKIYLEYEHDLKSINIFVLTNYVLIFTECNIYFFDSNGNEYKIDKNFYKIDNERIFFYLKKDSFIICNINSYASDLFYTFKIDKTKLLTKTDLLLPYDIDNYKELHGRKYTGYTYSDFYDILTEEEFIDMMSNIKIFFDEEK